MPLFFEFVPTKILRYHHL